MISDLDRVKEFISKYWSIPLAKLNSKSRLEDDLGITGDDAVEFFDLFSKEFEVDLRELELQKYFESEGVGLINLSWLIGKRRKVERSSHEITIEDLALVIKEKKWIDF